MNLQSNTPSNALIDLPNSPLLFDVASGDKRSSPIMTDRMYQIAAVTAGLFLLATLL